jgi:hypothetical protein
MHPYIFSISDKQNIPGYFSSGSSSSNSYTRIYGPDILNAQAVSANKRRKEEASLHKGCHYRFIKLI